MKIHNAHSYIVFLLVCLFLIPCTAKAIQRRDWGELSPSEKQIQKFGSWVRVTCGKGTSGPFSVSYIGTPSNGYLEVVVDDVVDTKYTNQYAYCKASSREGLSLEHEYRYYFDIAEGIGDITIVTARAYPGLMGTCDFDDKWEQSQWTDPSGKMYYFHETTESNAKLPDCSETAQNGVLYDFKGWSKGYEAGDVLSTTTTCQNLVAVGSNIKLGENYAPCYELVPHARLMANGGTVADDGTWSFNPSDMSYIAKGTSRDATVTLPNVQYSGYHANSTLSYWKNMTTGETKNAGQTIKLDGSVWTAVSDNRTTKVDLYKTIGLNSTEVFTVDGMIGCSLQAGASTFVSASYSRGDCTVKGLKVTETGQYGSVLVNLRDGSTRTYKFTVEDRTGIDQGGNGVFIVDTDDNIVIGENDAELTDNLYTDQCNVFTISSTNYGDTKVGFARSAKYKSQTIYSGTYHVVDKCPADNNNYIAFCLDPGRKGPGEMSGHKADYTKVSDINIETDFGKLIAYIVKNLHVTSFGNPYEYITERVAAHVAIRVSAIKNGLSTAVDSADLVYSSHYYPYEAVAEKLAELDNDGDVSPEDAKAALKHITSSGNGFSWTGSGYDYTTYYNKIAELLSAYDGSSGSPVTNAGFERTIDKTDVKLIGTTGYSITYEGTITVPAGTDSADLNACDTSNANDAGISCEVNYFDELDKVAEGNRKIYNYKVTIKAPNASAVKVPAGANAEKALSFVFEYNGSALVQSAFIANPTSGSDSLQRMLILTTSVPKVYVYFNIVPRNCELPFLNKDNCLAENSCSINKELFRSAGCCRYLIDGNTYKYLLDVVCEPKCTTSTLTPACSYTLTGKDKADVYTIREGEQYVSSGSWKSNVGSCVANVSDYYVNDGAAAVDNLASGDKFVYKDDAQNLRNIDAYKDNRYCQVTCKEDWEISMDSFGNFIGENAVAAGTYFQIISNDIFIQGTRTCYSSFINYDRFMANVVDLSSKVVENYNKYSEWSHAWTDLDRQDRDVTTHKISGSVNESEAVCVEYFDKCPDNYYWSDIGGTCRQVPNFGSTTGASLEKCESKPATYSKAAGSDDHYDYGVTYDNSGKNEDATRCTFTRYYCPGNDEPFGIQTLTSDKKYCGYYDYTLKEKKDKVPDYRTRGTETKVKGTTYTARTKLSDRNWSWAKTQNAKAGCRETPGNEVIGQKCYSPCSSGTAVGAYCYDSCPSGKVTDGAKCYDKVCPDGTRSYTGKCYVQGDQGCTNGGTSYSATENGYNYLKYCKSMVCPSGTTEDAYGTCRVDAIPNGYTEYSYDKRYYRKYVYVASSKATLEMLPKYITTDLRCKVYGKSYSYTLNTANNIYVGNSDGVDVFYGTTQSSAVAMAGSGGGLSDTYTQNTVWNKGAVSYAKSYTHKCQITPAVYYPSARGSSSCSGTTSSGDNLYSGYTKSNSMFCTAYADLTGDDKDKAFCKVNGIHNNHNSNASTSNFNTSYKDLTDAFDYMIDNMKDQTKSKAHYYRSQMSSYNSSIYSHAYDLFDCQHFQLHNNTDDMDSSKANNNVRQGAVLGAARSYVKIPTEFNPTAAYTYDEEQFMTILGKDNVLEPFTEKNDTVYGGKGNYAAATNAYRDVAITLPNDSSYDTKLYRNYLRNYYYNPDRPWSNTESTSYKEYWDNTEETSLDRMDTERKQIVLCSVGTKTYGIGTYEGKEGAVESFTITGSNPEWIGGRCFQYNVYYKKIHYVKSSISNSSFYKNKGYWYVSGSDLKEHGDDFADALENANNRPGSGTRYDVAKQRGNWSRLGSFNVFPVSMATPRNLYQYTYTFGQIGSYSDGKLGRVMGTTKSIIKDNTRSCFYEVFEEVCLCCGYKLEPGDVVNEYLAANGTTVNTATGVLPGLTINGSDTSKIEGSHSGTLSFYSNSVSLGDLDLGRTDSATNWSEDQLFMYNGNSSLTTNKGSQLKALIEQKGETIYTSKPEYAYYLTPDALKEIRHYNDAVGYELNYNNLKNYGSNAVACSTTSCSDSIYDSEGEPKVIFQHYGSKFLAGEVAQSIKINNFSYGAIKDANDRICIIGAGSLYNMANMIENQKCRWIDYVQTGNSYTDPATGETPAAFRLAFK